MYIDTSVLPGLVVPIFMLFILALRMVLAGFRDSGKPDANLQQAYSLRQNGTERLMVGPNQVLTLLKQLWTSSLHDYRNERLRIQLALALIIFSATGARVGGTAELGSYSHYTPNFLPTQHNHPLLNDASTREPTAPPSPESIYKHCEYHSLLNVHLLPDTHTVGPV